MVNFIKIIGITLLIALMACAFFYWVWLRTRIKKQTWIAKCFMITDGIKPQSLDKDGKPISNLKLNNMIPYRIDILESVPDDWGKTIFRLQNIGLTTEEVKADNVENWGIGKKEVSVLIENGTAKLLTKGYDNNDRIISQPMQRSKLELIKSDMAASKAKLRKEKHLWASLAPWLAMGLSFVFTGFVIYMLVSQSIEGAKINADSLELFGKDMIKVAQVQNEGIKTLEVLVNTKNKIVLKNKETQIGNS